jgi:DHA1 family tetracycline resistance protein-like MFS transporter
MKPLVPLLLSTFFYIFALSLLIPVFPTLISFAFPESASVTPESPEVTKLFGDLSLLKSCLDLLSLPVLGGLSDYLGRRPLHLFCLACAVLQVLLLLPPPLTSLSSDSYRAALYLSRALSGVSDAVLALLFASLTDLAGADASLLPVNYGKVGLVFGFSFTFGPLFSVLLFSQLGVSAVLAAALLSSLAALLTYAFFVPDTLPRSSRSPVPPKPHKHAGFLLSLTPLDQLRLLRATPVVSSYLAVFVLHEWATGV